MSALTNRVGRLELQAAKLIRPAGSWATLWQNLEIVYGSGRRYTPEELAELDRIDSLHGLDELLEKVYGSAKHRGPNLTYCHNRDRRPAGHTGEKASTKSLPSTLTPIATNKKSRHK